MADSKNTSSCLVHIGVKNALKSYLTRHESNNYKVLIKFSARRVILLDRNSIGGNVKFLDYQVTLKKGLNT